MAEPEDMVVPMLREMRAESSARSDGVDRRLERADRFLAALEKTQASLKQALAADSLENLARRVRALEKTP
jgi:hypothetical protein